MLYIWFVLIAVAIILKYRSQRKNEKLPGPPSIPFFGNIFQIIKAAKKDGRPLTYFAKKYGDIYQLKIPTLNIVVLSSHRVLSDIINKKETLARNLSGTLLDRNPENLGIIFAHGKVWEETRRWAIRHLRDFGFRESQFLEETLKIEISNIFDTIDKIEKLNEARLVHVHELFISPVGCIMFRMITGDCNSEDRETVKKLRRHTEKLEKAIGFNPGIAGALAHLFHFLCKIFPKQTLSFDVLECMRKHKIKSKEIFNDAKEKMEMSESYASESLAASSETTASYLEAVILYLVLYPDTQEKIYQEIIKIVGANSEIKYQDKSSMPNTEALIHEVHRVANIFYYLIPRRAWKDFKYKNYHIKKGTLILPDMHTIYRNQKVFEDPFAFKPERFIGLDGKFVNHKHVTPFGIGKRSCPGDRLADTASFIIITNFIRKYKLSTVPGEPKPRTEGPLGFIQRTYPFSILLYER